MKTSSLGLRKSVWPISIFLAVALFIGSLIVGFRRRAFAKRRTSRSSFKGFDDRFPDIVGLSEKEAVARTPPFDLDEELEEENSRFLRKVIKKNLLTIYNINLFGIALIMLLLDEPISTFVTLLLLTFNVVLRVYQIMFTKRSLNTIIQSIRPQATAIRDGRLRSIDLVKIVEGDYLIISTGDEFLVSGELIGAEDIIVEEKLDEAEFVETRKSSGDSVNAGSYCLGGYSVYRSREYGVHRYKSAPRSELNLLPDEHTTFQRLIETILRVLFGFVVVVTTLLALDAVSGNSKLINVDYRNAFSILFGIAPFSLFFILLLKDVIGMSRISDRGALLYDTRSIATLAEIDTLCISERGLLSGLRISINPAPSTDGSDPLSKNLIRSILGDIFQSVPDPSTTFRSLAESLPGDRHIPEEIQPFFQAYGWYGASFKNPAIRGTYVLGLGSVMENHFIKDSEFIWKNNEESTSREERGVRHVLQGIFSRDRSRSEEEIGVSNTVDEFDRDDILPNRFEVEEAGLTVRQKLQRSVKDWLTPIEELETPAYDASYPSDIATLFFAYLPEIVPLHDGGGRPMLPEELILLANVDIGVSVQADAKDAIKTMLDTGRSIKILSENPVEMVQATTAQLGFPAEMSSSISGKDLEILSDDAFSEAVRQNFVFGDLTPTQKSEVVGDLQTEEDTVLMVGSNVSDLSALRKADLSMVPTNSSQAAIQYANIILLHDSIDALPDVISIGERLVNGMLNTFKLYFSQIIMQLILILLVIFKLLQHFPYSPVQASVISVFTVDLPNIFLIFWAPAARVTDKSMSRKLAYFVLPAAVTGAFLVLSVDILFFGKTIDLNTTRMAVTYSILLAGWIRILFLQPPTPFWVGGAPLRGDPRVIRLVLGCAGLLLALLLIPFIRDALEFELLASWFDYLLVVLAVFIWTITLRTIWRIGIWKR